MTHSSVLSLLFLLLLPLITHASPSPHYPSRDITLLNDHGNITVIDSSTDHIIPQASASDGGALVNRNRFSVPPVLWIAFGAVIGTPMALAGSRGWRLTTGCALGLSLAVAGPFSFVEPAKRAQLIHILEVWASFVNTLNSTDLASSTRTSDLILTLLVMGAFLLGFGVGVLQLAVHVGIACTGAAAGLATGSIIVIIKPGLLIPVYTVNWVIIALLMAAGLLGIVFQQRMTMVR